MQDLIKKAGQVKLLVLDVDVSSLLPFLVSLPAS